MQVPETGHLECLTTGTDTETLRRLAVRHGRLVIIHDETVCEVPDCDVPAVRACVVTRASESRTGVVTRATRAWSITVQDRPGLTDVTRPGGDLTDFMAPVVTWGEWQSLDGGWESRTYAELCSLVAGMPS